MCNTDSRIGYGLGRLLFGLLTSVALLAAGTLYAEAEAPAKVPDAAPASDSAPKTMEERLADIPTGEEGVEEILGTMTERLTLTPEQITEIRPVIVDTVSQMEKSRDRLKAGEITPMVLVMQLQVAGQKAAMLIEPHLTKEQVVEYKAMRQEQKQEMMKEMMKSRQKTAGAAAK